MAEERKEKLMPAAGAQDHGPGSGPGQVRVLQKPKNMKGSILFIWSYLKKRRHLLYFGVAMVVCNIVAQLSGTAYMQPLIDTYLAPVAGTLTGSERLAGLASGLLVLGAFYMTEVLTNFLRNRTMLKLTQGTINEVRRDLFDHLQDLPVRYFDTHTHGELMSRFTNDVDTLNDALNNSITTLLSSSLTLIGVFFLMLRSSIPMTIVVLVMTPLLVVVARKLMSISSKYFVAQQMDLGSVNSYVEEMISGQKVIKVFNHEENAKAEFAKLNEQLRNSATTAQSYSGMMMPLTRSINSVIYALTAALGGLLAISGHMSVGTLIVFLQLVQQFGRPINEISNQYNAVITAIAGAERIEEVMREQPEPADPEDTYSLDHEADGTYYWQRGEEKVPVQGDVRFNHVNFGYVPEKVILKDLSLFARPGEKIAFVGSTGAGKTTITNLITRFYDIDEGTITVDGIPLHQIARSSLRRAISVVLQDTHLFTGTVRENIRYGRLAATDEEVEAAAKLASADSFIRRLPHGYETVIEGDGANLSQGQRQLLNIARAAVADAPVLILDEATSSVDTRTERHIEKGLDRLMQGRTTFVIAHRLSTVRNSNAILVLEQGEVIERGTHDDLLAMNGRYYQLYTGAVELD